MLAVEPGDFGCAGHVHPGTAIQCGNVCAVLLEELSRLLGRDSHHGRKARAVGGAVIGERADDAGCASGAGGGDA